MMRRWVLRKMIDARYGARPMARLIHDKIKKPLAREILFGKLADGGSVTVEILEEQLHLQI